MSVIVPFPLCGYKISIYSDVVVALLTTWLIPSVHVGGPILRVVVKLLLFIICWLLLGRIRLMLLLNFSLSYSPLKSFDVHQVVCHVSMMCKVDIFLETIAPESILSQRNNIDLPSVKLIFILKHLSLSRYCLKEEM